MSGDKIAFVLGTRPELLKLVSVLQAMQDRFPGTAVVVDTGQQTALKDGLVHEYRLQQVDWIKLGVSQSDLSAQLSAQVAAIGGCLRRTAFRAVVVQGDTTSALAGAMSAVYAGVPVVHIEAGLRSGNLAEPFPEEIHRRLIAVLAQLHLAPNPAARQALTLTGVSPDRIVVVGNPLADLCRPGDITDACDVVVTMHRRENRESGIRQLCKALSHLAPRYPRLQFRVVGHSHPETMAAFVRHLPQSPNLRFVDPLPHKVFLALLHAARLVMTDSGGVQEEAAMIGKPTVILRNVADRVDGFEQGSAWLAGTSSRSIIDAAASLLDAPPKAAAPAWSAVSLVGQTIVDEITHRFPVENRRAS